MSAVMNTWKSDYICSLLPYIVSSGYKCEPRHENTCLMPYANNKDADQPAHAAQPDQRLCYSLPR